MLTTSPKNWTTCAPPRIHVDTPLAVVRAMKEALRAVDRDIEQQGAISYESVELVRAALALSRQ